MMKIIDSASRATISLAPSERVRFCVSRYRPGVACRGTLGTLTGIRDPVEIDGEHAAEMDCYRRTIGRGMRALREALIDAAKPAEAGRARVVVSLYDHSQKTWWPVRCDSAAEST